MFYYYKRKSFGFLLGMLVILFIIGYSYGYLNKAPGADSPNDQTKIGENHKISLLDSPNTQHINTNVIDNSEVSFDTVLVFNKIYSSCMHTTCSERTVYVDEVGLTKDNFQQKYSDWNITQFSPERVIFERVLDGYCSNHFIVKDNQGYVTIYRPSEVDMNYTLIEKTSVRTDWLSSELMQEIMDGKVVDTREEIEFMLENWDS